MVQGQEYVDGWREEARIEAMRFLARLRIE